MSFNGIVTFDRNLRALMECEAFKQADDATRLQMTYRLLNSKYGRGAWCGFGKVHALPESPKAGA